MGIANSVLHGRGGQESDQDVSLAFWIGNMPSPGPLPSCWDELSDWTNDASEVFQVYLRIRRAEADVETVDEEMQFLPFVASDKSSAVYDLPSMEWLQRAQFFAENVRHRSWMIRTLSDYTHFSFLGHHCSAQTRSSSWSSYVGSIHTAFWSSLTLFGSTCFDEIGTPYKEKRRMPNLPQSRSQHGRTLVLSWFVLEVRKTLGFSSFKMPILPPRLFEERCHYQSVGATRVASRRCRKGRCSTARNADGLLEQLEPVKHFSRVA